MVYDYVITVFKFPFLLLCNKLPTFLFIVFDAYTLSGWHYMYGASTPLAVIIGIGMWWLPTSPRWLLLCAIQGKGNMQDLRESAMCCLCRIRGEAIGNSAPERVDEMLDELSYIGDDKEARIVEMFKGKMLKSPYYRCRISLISAGILGNKGHCSSVIRINFNIYTYVSLLHGRYQGNPVYYIMLCQSFRYTC